MPRRSPVARGAKAADEGNDGAGEEEQGDGGEREGAAQKEGKVGKGGREGGGEADVGAALLPPRRK